MPNVDMSKHTSYVMMLLIPKNVIEPGEGGEGTGSSNASSDEEGGEGRGRKRELKHGD